MSKQSNSHAPHLFTLGLRQETFVITAFSTSSLIKSEPSNAALSHIAQCYTPIFNLLTTT